eukprot:scaffold5499_cov137-Skeletonema_dohrnii-CCMP3373.AAC.2
MPMLHFVRWSKLQTSADDDNHHNFFSPSNCNDKGCLIGKIDNNHPTSTLSVSIPTICQSSTSVERRDEAATTVIASSATTSPGNTLDLNTQKRLRDEHEHATDETARKKHPRKRCSADGCTKFGQSGGVCVRHGAKVKRCSSEGCTKQAQKRGLCIRHGAKVKRKKRCSIDECTNQAKFGGVCIRHGAKAKNT